MRRHLLCFGNELHGDDGFGPAVGRRLLAQPLPRPWELHQIGTRGLDALSLLLDCEAAIVIDAAAPHGQPGRLRELDVSAVATEASIVGHGMGLGFVLRALQASGEPRPALRILTAEMADVSPFRMSLSPAVAEAVDAAVVQIRLWMSDDAAPC
ncbi:hydrogenase maturation protease [Leptothrix cholodnii SP-6]|uniref:Hydrogenase maturation protease n=1 Tax=Leptothrix cholodnii (strain ATCC 51168 / LMG 8142 / SP-6) TaxID=395495 RepID=B1Y6B0_LEPCP|nr:hydrogenase maturation protease [Leptothrix cholodnii]ACB33615.1 hydrogenase maturation protease [Leptothrix cholodnii SP-6]